MKNSIQLSLDFRKQYPHDKYHLYILNELIGKKHALEALADILRISLFCGDSQIDDTIGAIAIPRQIFARNLYTDESCDAYPKRLKLYCSVDTIYSDRVHSIVNGFLAGFKANRR